MEEHRGFQSMRAAHALRNDLGAAVLVKENLSQTGRSGQKPLSVLGTSHVTWGEGTATDHLNLTENPRPVKSHQVGQGRELVETSGLTVQGPGGYSPWLGPKRADDRHPLEYIMHACLQDLNKNQLPSYSAGKF